ncbi:12655_t:CDS:2 [Gigaspora rosea]|nr:12655_t:CDS:2 [Gigaspora rosea]
MKAMNLPKKLTAFNSHWKIDDESETSLEEIIPFNSHPEASNDEGDEPTVEITSLNSGRKASDNIFIGSSNRTSSLAPKRNYIKSSWVWKYFKLSKDRQYDVCDIATLNLSNKKVKNDNTIQQTLLESFEQANVKKHKEPRN